MDGWIHDSGGGTADTERLDNYWIVGWMVRYEHVLDVVVLLGVTVAGVIELLVRLRF